MQNIQHLDAFNIIGISIETTNVNGQTAQDLGQLWGQFYSQNILAQIPNKIGTEIYGIYTDYESDYRGKYTAIIGCKVSSLDELPKGLIGRTIQGGTFQKYIAKGEMPAAVGNAWQNIWAQGTAINRAYIADFDVYGANAQNGKNSEVTIFLGVHE